MDVFSSFVVRLSEQLVLTGSSLLDISSDISSVTASLRQSSACGFFMRVFTVLYFFTVSIFVTTIKTPVKCIK